jgi:hypothetical protein
MFLSATNYISGSLFIKLINGGASFLYSERDLSELTSSSERNFITSLQAESTTEGLECARWGKTRYTCSSLN